MKIFIIIFIYIFMIAGCSNNISQIGMKNFYKVSQTKEVSKDRKVRKISKKQRCKIVEKTLKKWQKNYLSIINSKKITSQKIGELYDTLISNTNNLNRNCNLKINLNPLKELTKHKIIFTFIKENNDDFIVFKTNLDDKLTSLIKEYNIDILNIIENYNEEMKGLSFFTSDKEMWQKYFNKPLKEILNEINMRFISTLDKSEVRFIIRIYEKFKNYSNQYKYISIIPNIPNYKNSFKENYVLPKLKINYNDKSSITNTIISAIEATPLLGDGIALLGIDFKSNANARYALKKINEYIIIFRKDKRKQINKDTKELKNYIDVYLNNILDLKE